ncbi:MAG: nicotinamide-nucleotide adenylyltransferase [Thermoplasmata archaeon]|nr:nicotinamide-nucleotide adenylyltransferase [Thermoplasmata archaeon]
MRALVVGRFQPLHNGHAKLIKQAVEECVDVTLAIGSTNAKPSLRNPFTTAERVQMLQAVFPGLRILELPDLNDPPRWTLEAIQAAGGVDRVYGNDPATTGLFELAGVPVVSPGLVEREKYEATNIRRLMAEDDPAWRKCVPPQVVKLLDQWQAPKRLLLMA